MADFVASSGTLVTTALETAGYHFQAYILDAYATPMAGSIGSMLYLVGVLTAVVSFILMGQYKLWPWFLLGPILFFSMIFPRTDAEAPQWLFGGEVRDQTKLDDYNEGILAKLGKDKNDTARVSSVFAQYNNLVSGTIQEVVRVLTETKDNLDYKFLLRAQLHGDLEGSFIPDPEFRDLFHEAFLRDCGKVFEKIQLLHDPTYLPEGDEALTERRKVDLENSLAMTKATISPLAMRYLAGLRLDYGGALGSDGNPLWIGPQSGQDVGAWMDQIESFEQGAAATNAATREAQIAAATKDVERWNVQTRKQPAGDVFSCQDVWGFVFSGIHRYARQKIEDGIARGESQGIDGDSLLFDLLRAEGFNLNAENIAGNMNRAEKLNQLSKIVSKYMLSNEINQGSTAAFLSSFSNRSPEYNTITTNSENTLDETDRQKRKEQEWKQKTEAFTSAMMLPYYQGLALYYLAMLWPFFSMMLVVPGKYPAFLSWFMLWLWVKSWDVGFAIVMCLDEILFSVMGAGRSGESGVPENVELPSDISEITFALKNLDGSFGATTYYTIMAIALQSVPIVSAQLILGGLKGGAGIIARGMNQMSTHLGFFASRATTGIAMDNARSAALELGYDRLQAAEAASAAGVNPYSLYKNDRSFDGRSNRMSLFGGLGPDASWRFSPQRLMEAGKVAAAVKGLADAGKEIGERHGKPGEIGRTQNGLAGTYEQAAKNGAPGSVPHELRATEASLKSASARNKRLGNRLGNGTGSAIVDDGIVPISQAVEPIASAVYDGTFKLAGAQLDLISKWMAYDNMNAEMAQRLTAISGLYGALTLPWTEGDAYAQELKYELEILSQEVDIAKSVIKGGLNLTDWLSERTLDPSDAARLRTRRSKR